jgi:uncharacterized membrane protein
MSNLTDWLGENKAAGVLAVILGFGIGVLALVLGFNLLITLATTAPAMVGLVVPLLGMLAVVAVAGIHSDASDDEEEMTREHDPLSVLKERYARGELSEAEFEHQVAMLLDVDEIAGRDQEVELERA